MKKESVSSLFSLYSDACEKASKAKEIYEKLDADSSLLKQKLISLIPPGEVRDNVIHKHFERKNVSYAKALQSIRDRLVPKTKQLEADVIVEEFTSVTVTDKIELFNKE